MSLERKARQHRRRKEEHPGLSQASFSASACELDRMKHQLQEIEERFHALATVSGQIVWTARPDGMSYDAPFWRAYTGQSRADVEGLGWMEAIHPEDREHTCTEWLHAVATKTLFQTEYRLRRADGVYHPFLARGAPLLDEEGNAREWVGVCTDISERKQLEEENARLLKGEQQARTDAAARASQLEATIEAMTEGVGIYTPEGFALYTNRSGRKILGIEDLDRFRLFTSRHHPQRIALLHCRDKDGNPYPPERSPLTRALQGEVVPDAESEDMLITALDGYERYLSATAAPIRDTEGQLTGAVFVYRDVTERRRLEHRTSDALGALLEMAEALVGPASAEERLLEEEPRAEISTVTERLAALTARVLGCERVGIAAVDPETTRLLPLAMLTPSAEEEQRWWATRLYAPRLCENPDPTLVERLCAEEAMVLDMSNRPLNVQHPFQLPTLLIAPMCVGKRLVGLLSIGHNTPEHVYTPQEIALAGAVAKLTALVIERDHLLRQREEASANALALREANRRMDTFLGIASHELNTPLTTLKLYHQIIQRRLQQQRARQETLSAAEMSGLLATLNQQHLRAQAQIERLSQLVSDLLDVSRIQAGHLHLRLKPVDVVDLVRSAVEEQRQANLARTIELVLPSPAEIFVWADAERIGQVVTNYLTNALKYSFEECQIEVGIERLKGQAQVWVHDQGPGLTAKEQEHLWERFYRVPGVEIRSGSGIGLGLGLHICKTIIEEHHGQVGVESAPGKGSTFWFTIPLAPSQERPAFGTRSLG